jgi:hypothetical protein
LGEQKWSDEGEPEEPPDEIDGKKWRVLRME